MVLDNIQKQPFFGLDEWEIIEESYSPEKNYHSETIFATGNGFIGMRGTFEEGLKDAALGFEGTFLNGIYESGVIEYGEAAYAFPERSQTMVNVANGKVIRLYLEDEAFDMATGTLIEYRRSISMKEGVLRRSLVWQSPGGKRIKLDTERLVCLQRKNLAVISYNVTPLNFEGNIKIISGIDGSIKYSAEENDPRVGAGLEEGSLKVIETVVNNHAAALLQRTKNTGISIACAFGNTMKTDCRHSVVRYEQQDRVGLEYHIEGKKNNAINYTKYIIYATSEDKGRGAMEQAFEMLGDAAANDYVQLKEEQKDFLSDYWEISDVVIKGDAALQQAIRFNLFHLLQSAGRDGRTNMCAKGLTGEGYEGHYFWDTEMYIIPAFLYSHPEISRKLLEYRYNTLDKARERAREMSHEKGALFPWRTIDGSECSAFFPAGTAQYHIDADIAFAVKKYMEATQDEEFMLEFGAELLFETARLWADLGFFSEEKAGKFCINCVTGPDEYTAIVNNNCYTNLMAKENMQYARETALWMKSEHGEAYRQVAARLGLEEAEIDYWGRAAQNIYIPYNERLGIHPQDDSFLDKKIWDFENTPEDKYPLLLHFHPLVIYRHQVCKQADIVLALFLLGDKFSREEKIRNYEYYEKVTTHDSSLSSCIFSIMACDIGYYEKAYDYFKCTARMDLDDYQGNTKHGVHTANMAGSWMSIVNGFAGMRVYDGKIGFSPSIPDNWAGYSFKVVYRGRHIKVNIDKKQVRYELLAGDKLAVLHNGSEFILDKVVVMET